MKKILHHILYTFVIILHCFLCNSCGTVKYINTESVKYITKDSLVFRTDTLLIELPSESRYIERGDTLSHLETSVAESDASIDSEGILRHSLRNKGTVKKEVVYKDKYIETVRDSIVYQDRIQYVDKVIEKVPKWSWWSLGMNVMIVLYFGFRIYKRFI